MDFQFNNINSAASVPARNDEVVSKDTINNKVNEFLLFNFKGAKNINQQNSQPLMSANNKNQPKNNENEDLFSLIMLGLKALHGKNKEVIITRNNNIKENEPARDSNGETQQEFSYRMAKLLSKAGIIEPVPD